MTNANDNTDYLKHKNTHTRDRNIIFYEHGHKYTITTDPTSKYVSVTTWIHQQFPKFNADKIISKMMASSKWKPGHRYWGMTPNEIKQSWDENRNTAATAGTNMHFQIECFMNSGGNIEPNDSAICENRASPQPPECTFTQYELLMSHVANTSHTSSTEWKFFTDFVTDHPNLTPYRTEWMVYHEELKFAGSIDMVYAHNDGSGEISIYDWKRSKEITKNGWGEYGTTREFANVPNCNFWHYSMQLNIYRYILENKYNQRIRDLYLVRMHPDNSCNGTYELIKVPIIHLFDETLDGIIRLPESPKSTRSKTPSPTNQNDKDINKLSQNVFKRCML